MKEKTFVLDANVLLHDPEAMMKFPKNEVIIPVPVLEELDKMKRLPSDLGRNSRAFFRKMDSLHMLGEGNVHEGIRLSNGSTIRIQLEIKADVPRTFALSLTDNRIILSAYLLGERGKKAVFVSKDFAALLKPKPLAWKQKITKILNFPMTRCRVAFGKLRPASMRSIFSTRMG